MTSQNVNLTMRLPSALMRAIEERASEETARSFGGKVSRAQIVRKAVADYVGRQDAPRATSFKTGE